ncbi:hypothetical protein THIX_20004 [Thiomonas sp. X19]|nr:hypothetical protein THIX_20004 [Thiomonas sp. X19]
MHSCETHAHGYGALRLFVADLCNVKINLARDERQQGAYALKWNESCMLSGPLHRLRDACPLPRKTDLKEALHASLATKQ